MGKKNKTSAASSDSGTVSFEVEETKDATEYLNDLYPVEYEVKAGVSVTSMKGILAPGTVVKAEWFPEGQITLDNLVKIGTLVPHKVD
jgi:hypothetical protein